MFFSHQENVIWLLYRRLVEIPNGYHGGEGLESQGMWISQWGLSMEWKQRLKVSLPWNGQEAHAVKWEKRRLVGHLWGAQGTGLVLKHSTNPGAEWEAVWAISSLLRPTTTRAAGACMEDASRFAQVTFSLPDSATWVFGSMAGGSGWCQRRQRPAVDWRGWQGVPLPKPELHDNKSSMCPAAACSKPQGPSAHHAPVEGWHPGVDWIGKPSRQATSRFPLSCLHESSVTTRHSG